MKKIKSLGALAVFGLLALAAKAQIESTQTVQLYLPVNNAMNVALVGQVQQEAIPSAPRSGVMFQTQKTTKLTINTRSLLAMIAADQGFTLPAKAKLKLLDDTFLVLNQDNTVFTNVDRELLSLTYVTNVLESTLTQTPDIFATTITITSIAVLTYNGCSTAFTLNCYGKAVFHSQFGRSYPFMSHSYSCQAFGSGTCNGQNMVIKGSLSGKETLRGFGGVPGQPPGGQGGGGHPQPPIIILPAQPIDPGMSSSGGAVIIGAGSSSTIIRYIPIPIDIGVFSSNDEEAGTPVAPEPSHQ